MSTLGIYEKAMPDAIHFGEKLACAKEAGFDFLEISIDETEGRLARLNWTARQLREQNDVCRDTSIFIETMCLSGHRKYPFGSADAKIRERSLDIMKKAIDFSASLGIRIIQLAGYDVYYEPSTEQSKEFFLKNLQKSTELAAAAGVILGFETMETPFMNTVEKAMHYVKLINSPYLQVYPDIGNISNGTENVLADLETGRGHIAAAHLKETKPGVFRDLKFGEGCVDFPATINALLAQGVRKFNAEFWYDGGVNYEQECKKAHDFLRPLLKVR